MEDGVGTPSHMVDELSVCYDSLMTPSRRDAKTRDIGFPRATACAPTAVKKSAMHPLCEQSAMSPLLPGPGHQSATTSDRRCGMRILELSLKNFRCFKGFALPLAPAILTF